MTERRFIQSRRRQDRKDAVWAPSDSSVAQANRTGLLGDAAPQHAFESEETWLTAGNLPGTCRDLRTVDAQKDFLA